MNAFWARVQQASVAGEKRDKAHPAADAAVVFFDLSFLQLLGSYSDCDDTADAGSMVYTFSSSFPNGSRVDTGRSVDSKLISATVAVSTYHDMRVSLISPSELYLERIDV
jgi:hypothetical protein